MPQIQTDLLYEVLDCQVIFPVIIKALIELSIFFLSGIIRVSDLNGLSLVQFFLVNIFPLNHLYFLFLILSTIILLILAHIFSLGLLLIIFIFLFLLTFLIFSFITSDFFLSFLLQIKGDGITYEL